MDFQLPSLLTLASSIFTLLLFLYILLWKSKAVDQPPEADGGWPIIGHLHRLGGTKPPFVILGDLADKYGPIFTIRMGVYRTVIISNWEMAKQCFTTNDRAFAGRPKLLATHLMGYNNALFGLSPYGPCWCQVRKIATMELLSNHRLEKLSYIRDSEVKTAIKEIYELWVKDNGVVVDMKKWFGDIILNVMKAFRDFFQLTGTFVVSDVIPYMRWLDLGGHEKAMKKIAKLLYPLLDRWLQEHKQKITTSEIEEEHDFMDVMISNLHGAQEFSSCYDADTINKATSLTLILAGTETVAITLTWCLALLLNNRSRLKKAQEELDKQVGRDRQVNESDLNNLVYLQAIVKEALRLYPPGPLSAPHESIEDCTVGGYHLRKGTRLLVNLSKLHRDPNIWSDPNDFKPERFLTTHKHVEVRGQNFEYLPFGSGRRMCPGVSLALQVIQLTLAALLRGFEIQTASNGTVDMSEKYGLTNMKATPLDVLLTPRLPTNLY
ncbi:hypothetical protein FNV43_RR11427 [Rhamnella rubrinervis]|uniref:Cytochrome P450 n=1 Tax=Rhamnella rubrinervis TaxID=2594499 RepID=A0A8K0H6C9_9ROSA|nr:hypothetical protein FNV43_RR11427 [Rhamnella rubrinervis]